MTGRMARQLISCEMTGQKLKILINCPLISGMYWWTVKHLWWHADVHHARSIAVEPNHDNPSIIVTVIVTLAWLFAVLFEQWSVWPLSTTGTLIILSIWPETILETLCFICVRDSCLLAYNVMVQNSVIVAVLKIVIHLFIFSKKIKSKPKLIVILEAWWMMIYPQNGSMWMPDLPGCQIILDDSARYA